ncbi:4-methyl-5(B-hydroxyethyl)-thiazole monophosphate biosynthesis protein [Neiella marina]|uniref:4-methyl-5(B-hydroxyethyl)-thiazole monophosphate biosynthesis protein n=1 Tax=Neiella marina TaxID=508461 RepID=A0A8J2U3Q4_9GAMM|nr:DJ-1 family glyoxalase III [Neiella marina]GGA71392.1 4-methyl-5(B-hydroxyethyl)-thiazole monophosphate biosynthesis protein [Neiella marina]
MTQKVLLPVANGSEDMEVVIIADVLRRAGLDVVIASVTDSLQLTLARGIKMTADALLVDVVDHDYAMIVLPGGIPGSEALRDCPELITRLRQQRDRELWIAAICAAPAVVLQHHDLLGDAYVTCYPSFQPQLEPELCMAEEAVVVDEHNQIITSQAPGTAMRFALTLIDVLLGENAADEVEGPLCMLLEQLDDEELESEQ